MYLAFGDWDFGNIDGGIACSIDNGATWSMDPAWVTIWTVRFISSMKTATSCLLSPRLRIRRVIPFSKEKMK